MDIEPGQRVSVEIKAAPTNQAARKTLLRICAMDPAVRKRQLKRKENRPSWQTKRRGGRPWHHQMKSRLPVELNPGCKYDVRATVDVIRDLQSVERFVAVTPAAS